MKNSILIFLFLLLVLNQNKAQEVINTDNDEYVLPSDSVKLNNKMHFNFSTGVNVSFFNNNRSSTNLYYSPNMSYTVSPNFMIAGGITYLKSDLTNFRSLNDLSFRPFNGNISQYQAYIAAKYKLTDRLNIVGSIFYNITQYNLTVFNQNYKQNGFDRVGYSAFFEYKLSENTYLQGEIRINNSNNNLFYNSFENQGFFYQDSPVFNTFYGH